MKPYSETGSASLSWAWRMAWRDARRHRRKLILFSLSIVFGVAALTAVNSFSTNLDLELKKQAREIFSADVAFRSNEPFSQEVEDFFDTLDASGDTRSTRLSSMANFTDSGATRLVSVRALGEGFPLNGRIDTTPLEASVSGNPNPVAIVEDSLQIQYDLEIGDPVKIGESTFEIIGSFTKLPGENSFSGTFAPRILIPLQYLESTGLIQFGSRLRYRAYFSFENGLTPVIESILKDKRDFLREQGTRYRTVEGRQESIGDTLDQLKSFLGLVGLIALLLGGAGIAGSAQSYLQDKRESIAALRCLGATMRQCLTAYALQLSLVGFGGSILGGAIGISLNALLPRILAPLLPVSVSFSFAFGDIALSIGFGWFMATLFAFAPLLPLRRISPLEAIRAGFQTKKKSRDYLVWSLHGLISLSTIAFAYLQTRNALYALAYSIGLAVILLVLAVAGIGIRSLLKRSVSGKWPYVVRYGLSNLYRPQNRTALITATLGLGACLIFTLHLTESTLLSQSQFKSDTNQSNLILFDIQTDQMDSVSKILNDADAQSFILEPIVTMRLQSINGKPIAEIRKAKDPNIETWALNREYRSTYRDHLRPDEELIEGNFTPTASLDENQPIPISVEDRIVEALNLKMGDLLVWDVQGFPIESRVDSIRDVNWRNFRPNFFVVFPSGILESAPATYISGGHIDDVDTLVAAQRDIVTRFPNVSVVDLRTLLKTLKEVFDQASFVISFMGSFTIATGIIVLISTIVSSRYQRAKESVLLRTLGASSIQIRSIMAVEFILLGILAAVSGIGLSLATGWGVTTWVFELEYSIPWGQTLAAAIIVAAMTLVTGMLNSYGIASRSPLESIRNET